MSVDPIKFDNPYEVLVHQTERRRQRLERQLLGLIIIWIAASIGICITLSAAYFEVISLQPDRPFDSVADFVVFVLEAISSLSAILLIGNCLYHWSDLTWRTRVIALAIWIISIPGMLLFTIVVVDTLGSFFDLPRLA